MSQRFPGPSSRVELDPVALREAMQRRMTLHTPVEGAFLFPAVPGKVDDLVDQVVGVFASIRRPVGDEDRATLRAALLENLVNGFQASPHASVRVSYNTDEEQAGIVHWNVETFIPSDEAPYEIEGEGSGPPLLAEVPDARLIRLAAELGAPRDVTILDVGAGKGRNTLPLARLGYPIDAVEPVAGAADVLDELVRKERLRVHIARGDFWDPAFELPRTHYRLVCFSAVGSRLRGLTPVRGLLRRLSDVLDPLGVGLLPVFVTHPDYVPDPVARELAENRSCPMYSREELEDAAFGLPLELVSDESVLTYEREHQDAWPPTSWYADWVSGQHVFELPGGTPPVELCWRVYRRT